MFLLIIIRGLLGTVELKEEIEALPHPLTTHPLKLDIAVVSSRLLNRPTCFCSSIGFMSELGNTLLQGTMDLSLLIQD